MRASRVLIAASLLLATPARAQPVPVEVPEEPLPEGAEVIEVWDERESKPFDRDTELRLTGDQLAARGITDLAEALELIPEINIRDINRGGRQLDIRGARKGSIKIFVDGIPLGDPYRGNFDVSSIPVTDIAEIRVSVSPASPIDGSGGPAGVVEVHTRDAVGARMALARADAGTLRTAMLAASARSMLSGTWAVRVSATGDAGMRQLPAVDPAGMPTHIDEDRASGTGALRLEYRRGTRRAAVDFAAGAQTYAVPPSESETGQVIVIDAAHSGRAGLSLEDERSGWRLQLRGYGAMSRTRTHFYDDAGLDPSTRTVERVHAISLGGRLLANRPLAPWLEAIGSLSLDSDDGEVERDPDPIGGRSSIGEAAAGVELRRGKLSADAAAGVAVPLDTGADPWPEAKAAVKYRVIDRLQPRAVAGYKGRLPELRERFDLSIGNQAIGPEKITFAEVGALYDRNDWVEADVAGFWRRTDGMIRLSPETNMLANIGEVTVIGIDARVTLFPYRAVRGGASVELLDADSPELGEDPIDRMAERRGDAWVDGRWRRLRGLVRARYVGEMVDQGTTLPDYVLLDASSYVTINRQVSASLRVDNLLDERYLDRASGVRGTGRAALFSLQGVWD